MWPRFVIRPSRAMPSKFFLSLDNIGHGIASSWLVPICKNCVENLKTISYANGEFLKGQGEGPNFGRMGLKLIPNLIPGWTTHLRAQGVRVREALGFGVCFFAKKSCPDVLRDLRPDSSSRHQTRGVVEGLRVYAPVRETLRSCVA